jgi:hypothetical protein
MRQLATPHSSLLTRNSQLLIPQRSAREVQNTVSRFGSRISMVRTLSPRLMRWQ